VVHAPAYEELNSGGSDNEEDERPLTRLVVDIYMAVE
jgi:hypothetical protein